MSSIEEKLRTLRDIMGYLKGFSMRLKEDQNMASSLIADAKGKWNDSQLERFSSGAYLGSFLNSLNEINSQIDKAINFLENKYSTLETHRN